MTNPLHEKIAKILRLAENAGATESERAAAMAQAQKLAFKHNLDLSTINLDADDRTKVTEEKMERTTDSWKHYLVVGLATVNFCEVFYHDWSWTKKGQRQYVVMGRPHNIEVVKQMYAYLVPQMEEEALREVSRRGQNPRYALVTLMAHAKNHPYLIEELPVAAVPLGLKPWGEFRDLTTPGAREVLLTTVWDDLVPRLTGDLGLSLIMQYTGLTKAYASEIRPFIKNKDRIAPEVVKDLKQFRYGFEMGMAGRVYERLWADRLRLVDDAGDNGRALVVQETAAVQKYEEEHHSDLTIGNASQRKASRAGVDAGREAGNRVSIEERKSLSNSKELTT